MVERHLRDFEKITTWEAFENYGITRLSQYIMLLRREGMNIESVSTTRTNRYGKPVTFATYTLHRQGVQMAMEI